MCYGHDGHAALHASCERSGVSRRTFLRGVTGAAAAGALGLGAVGAAAPAAAVERRTGRRHVPAGLISIQLWTVRNDLWGSLGYDATLRYIADIGYPKVELALGYFGRTAEQLRAFYDSIGVEPTSSHDGISSSEAALHTKVANAVTLGQSYLVVPFLNSPNADDWKRWAAQMNAEAAVARSAGLRYGYHNHAHEFLHSLPGGQRPWDILTTELDPSLVHFEVDLYWVVTGGIQSGDGVADPEGFAIEVIRDAPQRVLQYHVKDRHESSGDMADLGTGMIDFPRIFAAHSVQEYIVENDTPDVSPRQTAQVGYRYLRNLRW